MTSGRLLMLDAGIEVFLVLAHDDDVHLGMLGVDVRVIGHARPHVGVEPERLARGDVEALEPAALRRRDRRFQEYLGAAQRLPRARLDAGAVAAQVDLLADLNGLDVDARAGLLQDLKRRVHDFGADAVAVRDRNWCASHSCRLPFDDAKTGSLARSNRPSFRSV